MGVDSLPPQRATVSMDLMSISARYMTFASEYERAFGPFLPYL